MVFIVLDVKLYGCYSGVVSMVFRRENAWWSATACVSRNASTVVFLDAGVCRRLVACRW